MTGMEATMEHLRMETANATKGGGVKYEGMAEHVVETCGQGETWMKINSDRDGEGLWPYIKLHQWFTQRPGFRG